MSAEIIAKLGLDDAKFDRGLATAESKFSKFTSRLRTRDATPAGSGSVDVALRAASRRVEQVEKTKLKLAGQSREDAPRESSVDVALRQQIHHTEDLSAAEKSLAATKSRVAFDEANTVGRIRIIQRELVGLARQRNTLQEGSAARLRVEEQIVSRVAQLRGLQRQQQSANILPSLPDVEQKANGILGLLRKKFSGTDLFKDTIKGLGFGLGAGAIGNAISNLFANAADRAKSMERASEQLLDNTRRWLGALGGPTRELELQVKQVNEINGSIALQKKLIEDLKANPLNFITDAGQQAIKEAEEGLDALRVKQAELATDAQIIALTDKRRVEALARQQTHETNLANLELRHAVEGQKFAERKRALQEEYNELVKQGALPSTKQENLNRQKALEKERELFYRNEREKIEDLQRTAKLDHELTQAELRDAGDVEKKQIRLNGLRRDYDTLKKRGARESDLEANRNEQRHLANEIKIDQRNAGRQFSNTLASVGESIAGRLPARTPPPRTRGRSERERIADRAAANQARAEEAARNGASPEFVASLAQSAARDFRKVGAQLGQSTSKIDKSTADSLGSPLLKTNQILEDIRKNLTPQAVK